MQWSNFGLVRQWSTQYFYYGKNAAFCSYSFFVDHCTKNSPFNWPLSFTSQIFGDIQAGQVPTLKKIDVYFIGYCKINMQALAIWFEVPNLSRSKTNLIFSFSWFYEPLSKVCLVLVDGSSVPSIFSQYN